jgi:hypothetical protein
MDVLQNLRAAQNIAGGQVARQQIAHAVLHGSVAHDSVM